VEEIYQMNQKSEKFTIYRQTVEKIRASIFAENSLLSQNFEETVASKISASLFNLLPQIPVSEHEELIRSIYFHQRWSVLDQYNLDLLVNGVVTEGVKPEWTEFKEKPVIFCTFHIGSYRLILPYLMQRGIKITILIDEQVASMQSEKFVELLREFREANNLSEDSFIIRDTSSGNIILSLLRDIKNGRSLLIFVDGNVGVGSNTPRQDSLSPLQFLGSTLFSRKGVGYISWMSACPIMPMVIYRSSDDVWANVLNFSPLVTPSRDGGREQFCADVMKGLYSVLEESVLEHYRQWESWRYIERSLDISELANRICEPSDVVYNEESLMKFNRDRYLLAGYAENNVLFDRASYRSTFISDELRSVFDNLARSPETIQCLLMHPQMSSGALKTMLKLGVVEMIQ
jgi:hypothetical protein